MLSDLQLIFSFNKESEIHAKKTVFFEAQFQ